MSFVFKIIEYDFYQNKKPDNNRDSLMEHKITIQQKGIYRIRKTSENKSFIWQYVNVGVG